MENPTDDFSFNTYVAIVCHKEYGDTTIVYAGHYKSQAKRAMLNWFEDVEDDAEEGHLFTWQSGNVVGKAEIYTVETLCKELDPYGKE